jgi:hypothetical protein
MPDESIAHENHHRARAQREEGLRARLRERGKTTGQTPFGLLGLANLDTRHKHQSESVWRANHSAVGLRVTANHNKRRRSWLRTRNANRC